LTPRVVFPAYDLDRGYPEGFRLEDAAHFEKSRHAHIPAISVLRLRRVSVIRMHLLQGLRIALRYCRSRTARPLNAREIARTLIGRLTLPTRRVPEASWALDQWSHGYFHWLLDAMPRILALEVCMPHSPLLLPERYTSRTYVVESLRLLDVEMVTYSTRERVAVDDLNVTTYPGGCDFNAPSLQRVGMWFRERDGASSTRGRRKVYISRKRAGRRRVLNEPALEDALRKRGFECLVFEDLSFTDQRNLMYGTSHLVSNHGAGLANMLFMPPESHVLELKSDSENINNCFFHLANALGHRYWYSINPGDTPDVQRADIAVDPDRLQCTLDAFLAGS